MKPFRSLLALTIAAMVLLGTHVFAQGVKVGKDTHQEHGWDFYTSHTECGGLRRDGKPQPRCKPKHANYEGPALGTCPPGTIFDIGLWQCWSCDKSKGFERTAAAVDSDRACAKPAARNESSNKERFKKATLLGSLCPAADANHEKAFFDTIRGGECWACPKGYNTNVLPHVEAPNKCTRPGGEEFKFAQRHKKTLWPHECSPGTFHDGWDGGGCWSCPSGFGRNGNPIYSDRACNRVSPAQDARATVRGTGKCEAGTITDPRNGGECWKCPESYDRVLLNPIDSPQACETTPEKVFSRAKYEAALTCAAGQHFDFIKVDDASLAKLKQTGRAGGSARAAPNGGTCWACPPNHKRSIGSVNDVNACQGETTEWYSAPFGEPGLFRLDGAQEVVLEILQHDRQKIDEVIREMVKLCAESNDDPEATKGCRDNPQKEIAEAWAEIQEAPGASGILMSMALGRIELAATDGKVALAAGVRKPTAADKRLLTSFASYVQKRRIYVAEEALKAFDAWRKADDYWKQYASSSQQNLLASQRGPDLTQAKPAEEPVPPPDWHEMVQNAMIGTVSGMTLLAGGTMAVVSSSPRLQGLVRPSYKVRQNIKGRMGPDLTKKVGEKVGQNLSKTPVDETAGKVASKTLSKGLSKGAGNVLKFLKAAAPAFVVTAVIEVVVEVVTRMDEHLKTERPHLETMLAQAKQPVDLTRDFLTAERASMIEGYWALAMSGASDPSPLIASQIKTFGESKAPAVQQPTQAVAAAAGTWRQMPGAAIDAGAGGNALWIIGNDTQAGGNKVFRWNGSAWQDMNGGALRLDVDPQGNAWVVNNAGHIFRHTGSGWVGVPGAKASDIGIGSNSTAWIVGTDTQAGGNKIYRWNGSAWQDMNGGALRLDVDSQGNAWVVNNAGQILRYTGSGWAGVPFGSKARDIGIGDDGSVFTLGQDGSVHKWNGSAWIKRDGNLAAITVGSKGVPVGVNAAKQIWMGYP